MLCCIELIGEVVRSGKDANSSPYLVLKVERPFLNKDQVRIYDEFIVFGWGGIMNSSQLYYHPGDYICLKGRIQNHEEFATIVVGEYIRLIYRNNNIEANK